MNFESDFKHHVLTMPLFRPSVAFDLLHLYSQFPSHRTIDQRQEEACTNLALLSSVQSSAFEPLHCFISQFVEGGLHCFLNNQHFC